MPMIDVTIRVRVEAENQVAGEDEVMSQAKGLSVDGVFLVDSEVVENHEDDD